MANTLIPPSIPSPAPAGTKPLTPQAPAPATSAPAAPAQTWAPLAGAMPTATGSDGYAPTGAVAGKWMPVSALSEIPCPVLKALVNSNPDLTTTVMVNGQPQRMVNLQKLDKVAQEQLKFDPIAAKSLEGIGAVAVDGGNPGNAAREFIQHVTTGNLALAGPDSIIGTWEKHPDSSEILSTTTVPGGGLLGLDGRQTKAQFSQANLDRALGFAETVTVKDPKTGASRQEKVMTLNSFSKWIAADVARDSKKVGPRVAGEWAGAPVIERAALFNLLKVQMKDSQGHAVEGVPADTLTKIYRDGVMPDMSARNPGNLGNLSAVTANLAGGVAKQISANTLSGFLSAFKSQLPSWARGINLSQGKPSAPAGSQAAVQAGKKSCPYLAGGHPPPGATTSSADLTAKHAAVTGLTPSVEGQ